MQNVKWPFFLSESMDAAKNGANILSNHAFFKLLSIVTGYSF